MFQDSLVESAALLRSHNRWPALLSIGAQFVAAAVILSLPLLHPEALPLSRTLSATLTPPRPPAPPPPPIHLKPLPATPASAPSAPTMAASTPSIFRDLLHSSGPPVEAPPLAIANLGMTSSAAPAGINTAPAAGPHIRVGSATSSTKAAPVPISSGVSAGLLLAPIRPDYPPIARLTRTEGTVVIQALISRSGTIESVRVLSGPSIFQQAAINAVRQAHYSPYLLNGQPTEVQTTITIHFHTSD